MHFVSLSPSHLETDFEETNKDSRRPNVFPSHWEDRERPRNFRHVKRARLLRESQVKNRVRRELSPVLQDGASRENWNLKHRAFHQEAVVGWKLSGTRPLKRRFVKKWGFWPGFFKREAFFASKQARRHRFASRDLDWSPFECVRCKFNLFVASNRWIGQSRENRTGVSALVGPFLNWIWTFLVFWDFVSTESAFDRLVSPLENISFSNVQTRRKLLSDASCVVRRASCFAFFREVLEFEKKRCFDKENSAPNFLLFFIFEKLSQTHGIEETSTSSWGLDWIVLFFIEKRKDAGFGWGWSVLKNGLLFFVFSMDQQLKLVKKTNSDKINSKFLHKKPKFIKIE